MIDETEVVEAERDPAPSKVAMMENDSIVLTIAGYPVTWIATRAITLIGDDVQLLSQIVTAHQDGTLLPVLPPKPRPLSWCEQLQQRFVLWKRKYLRLRPLTDAEMAETIVKETIDRIKEMKEP